MTVVLLDGNNLAMRSWHAAKGSMSVDGVDTGALQIFVNSLAKHLREEMPDRFVTVWDEGGSQFREYLYPDYKLARRTNGHQDEPSRDDLFQLIKEFLRLSQLPQWTAPGVEADDLIAAACLRHPDEHVVILSSDKDLLQCLGDNVEQVRFSSFNTPTDRWTKGRVITDLGYRPDQVPLVMALTGDSGDGIPGVRGVGPVKALKLLQAADWDLDSIMAARPEWQDVIRLTRALVTLPHPGVQVPDVPVFNPFPRPDSSIEELAELRAFCGRYELRTIADRIAVRTLWAVQAS